MSKAPAWAEALVSDVQPHLRQIVLRKQTRYWCFRLRTEQELDGRPAKGRPRGLKPWFEKQAEFDGWENFGATWDVDPENPVTAIPRYQTIHEEWDEVVRSELRNNEIAARKRRRKMRQANGSEGVV